MAAANLGNRIDIGEVDDFARIRDRKAWSVSVAIDGDDAYAELFHALECPPLMASGPHEEDRFPCGHFFFFWMNRKACLSQREISQPFVRSNRVLTLSSR